MTRPLTDAERDRILRAHQRIFDAEEMARELVRRAYEDRDAEIVAAVQAGASQTNIAAALEISRQAVHTAMRRASEAS
jgi:DNA-binding NarL/FixJ family response regulator